MSKKSSKVSNKNKQGILFQPNFPKNEFWDWNFENLTPDLELAPSRYQVCQFSGKTVNFDFFGPNLTKNGFWGQNFQKVRIRNQHLQDTMCANILAKRTNLNFST